LVTAAEQHPRGKQLLRCRLRARWSLQAKIIFWSLCGLELLLLGFFGSSSRWLWFILLTLPGLGWFLHRQARNLQSVIIVFLDELAKQHKLIKIVTQSGARQDKPAMEKPDPKSPFRATTAEHRQEEALEAKSTKG
jgi:hypothetical protein